MTANQVQVVLPIKSFQHNNTRLSGVLNLQQRQELGKRLAEHTLAQFQQLNFPIRVVTAAGEVAEWAQRHSVEVIQQCRPGLNQAATEAIAEIHDQADRSWLVCHADLPFLSTDDLQPVFSSLQEGRSILAPSADGGTTILGSWGEFSFAYGPGSFRTHLARLAEREPLVLSRKGLLMDLDTPVDLDWLRSRSSYWSRIIDG